MEGDGQETFDDEVSAAFPLVQVEQGFRVTEEEDDGQVVIDQDTSVSE